MRERIIRKEMRIIRKEKKRSKYLEIHVHETLAMQITQTHGRFMDHSPFNIIVQDVIKRAKDKGVQVRTSEEFQGYVEE